MKKTLFFIALSAVLFASCNKEMTNPVESKQEGKVVNFTINVGAPETKTYFEHDDLNGKYVPKWSNGDALGVFFNSWAENASLETTFTNTAANGSIASFSGTGTVSGDEQTIYAFYPASAFAKAYSSKCVSLNIPTTQRPTASSFDPSADILVNVPYSITIDNASVVIDDMQFRRIGSVLKVVLSDATSTNKLSSDKVQTLTLGTNVSNGALAGNYKYDFLNQKPAYNNGTTNEHMVSKSKTVTADVSANPIAINGSNAIFLIVNPCKLDKDSEFTVTVATDKHNITKVLSLPKDFTFPAGAMAELQISINDAVAGTTIDDVVPEPTGNGWYLVQNASWLHPNDLVVISNLDSNGAIGVASGTYRTEVTVSESAGVLTVGSATQFKLEDGDSSGWAFLDMDANVYLSWSDGNTITTDASVNDASSWNISIAADGEATISNVGTSSRIIQYNGGASPKRFACYTGTQKNVRIYKLYGTQSCATPVITPHGSSFEISCATPGAKIYYETSTTDMASVATPTTSSTLYSTSVSITATTYVKAIAVKAGYENSDVASETCTYSGTTDHTVTWTATSGGLGSGIGSGTITTEDSGHTVSYDWDYERTLISGASYSGWTSGCIQLGKNGGVENLTISTSEIPGTIKSVYVECSSYNNAHKCSITVGGTTYLASTATAKWTDVTSIGGTGTSSGEIVISFTNGTRALYIKSITVVYNN